MLDNQQIDELYHHGVIGMRWGHRKQRLSKASKAFINRVRGNSIVRTSKNLYQKRKNNAMVTSNTEGVRNKVNNVVRNRVSYKQATNEQLKRAIERVKLENAYQEAVNERMRLNPKKQSLVKKAVKKVFSEMVSPAVMNAGRNYLENVLKTKLEGPKILTPEEKKKKIGEDAEYKAKLYKNLATIYDKRETAQKEMEYQKNKKKKNSKK